MKLLLFVFSFFLVGCTQDRSGPNNPAAKEVPQIYYLKDGQKNWWGFPGKGLQETLGLRVVEESVISKGSAKEFLQQWNGRPADLLILGPGIPQSVFEELTLAKGRTKKILFLQGKSKRNSTNLLSIDVDEKVLTEFFRSYCSDICAKACEPVGEDVPLGLRSMGSASSSKCKIGFGLGSLDPRKVGNQINFSLDWDALILALLRDSLLFKSRGDSSEKFYLSFSNAFLLAKAGEALNSTSQLRSAEFLKKYALDHL